MDSGVQTKSQGRRKLMSNCEHEKSKYHYYMKEVCECGYEKVLDEDDAYDIIVDNLVYSKDETENALIRNNKRLKSENVDLKATMVAMRNCLNCKHGCCGWDGPECHLPGNLEEECDDSDNRKHWQLAEYLLETDE